MHGSESDTSSTSSISSWASFVLCVTNTCWWQSGSDLTLATSMVQLLILLWTRFNIMSFLLAMITLPLLIHINFMTRVHLNFLLIGLVSKTGKTIMLATLTLILTSKCLTTNNFIGLHILPSFCYLSLHWSLWYVDLTLQ